MINFSQLIDFKKAFILINYYLDKKMTTGAAANLVQAEVSGLVKLGNMAQDVMLAIDADVAWDYGYENQIPKADWK